MSRSFIVDQLLDWCQAHDITLDSRLEIQWNQETGVGVFSKDSIPPNTSAHINKDSVLSTRNCTISFGITPALAGPEALYHLSLALDSEILSGSTSRWSGYLQSLPEGIVDLPLFWSCQFSDTESEDKKLASEWAAGTEVSKFMGRRVEAIKEYFYRVAEPLLHRHFEHHEQPSVTLEGFFRAYSLVSSRSFLVDAFHGLAMVPIADAFNHLHENHVHIETDFSVCPDCGSLAKCAHDEDDESRPRGIGPERLEASETRLLNDPSDPYYEMVTDHPISPGSEVFNTYGENLSNAQLLGRYGFIIDDNDNDLLTWEFDQLYDYIFPAIEGQEDRVTSMTRFHTIWTSILHRSVQTSILDELSDSELVIIDQTNEANPLSLNGDGRISHSLWILLSVVSLVETLPAGDLSSLEEIEKALQSILDYQLFLEAGHQPPTSQFAPAVVFDRLVHQVVNMCQNRRQKLLAPGVCNEVTEPADLNALVDELPPSMHRTRCVLLIAIGECSLLDSCESAWRELIGLDQEPASLP